ncbi:hypothetical protein ROZALSC1DRAFT_21316 [Rozella allomycis CSF55]|uniref:RGS domain-containing protein n=1 Tax=Rozella allomycis (strain CSF55) TaxID=988480 RepID=A0A4P9YLJ6_ROZAC|nr:hypothetical protein ROZALSC1DRAFT_21316 [Rozella allomycis CSF55]
MTTVVYLTIPLSFFCFAFQALYVISLNKSCQIHSEGNQSESFAEKLSLYLAKTITNNYQSTIIENNQSKEASNDTLKMNQSTKSFQSSTSGRETNLGKISQGCFFYYCRRIMLISTVMLAASIAIAREPLINKLEFINCPTNLQDYLILYIVCIVANIPVPFFVACIRRYSDEFHIARQLYISLIFIGFLISLFTVSFVTQDTLNLFNIKDVGSYVYLIVLGNLLLIINAIFPLLQYYFYKKRKSCNTKREEPNAENDFFSMINNSDGFQQIKAAAVKDYSIENTYYIEDLKAFYKSSKNKLVLKFKEPIDPVCGNEDVQKFLRKIYSKYIQKDSKFELNLPSIVRETFEKQYNTEKTTSVLDPITKEVLRMIFTNTYAKIMKDNKA